MFVYTMYCVYALCWIQVYLYMYSIPANIVKITLYYQCLLHHSQFRVLMPYAYSDNQIRTITVRQTVLQKSLWSGSMNVQTECWDLSVRIWRDGPFLTWGIEYHIDITAFKWNAHFMTNTPQFKEIQKRIWYNIKIISTSRNIEFRQF